MALLSVGETLAQGFEEETRFLYQELLLTMRIRTALSGLAIAALATVGLAAIHANAYASSQTLETSADTLHGTLHSIFPSSYGSHGFDDAADMLEDELLLWEGGLNTECDVDEDRMAVQAAWDAMIPLFVNNGVFLNATATTAFYDCFYDKGIVDVYLSLLLCKPPAPADEVSIKRKRRQNTGGMGAML
jgi:hypothetical protein